MRSAVSGSWLQETASSTTTAAARGTAAAAAAEADGLVVGRARLNRTRQVGDVEVVFGERHQRVVEPRHWSRAGFRLARSFPDPVDDLPDHGQGRGRRGERERARDGARTPAPPPPPPPPDHGKLLSSSTSDAHFDYDKSDIRPDAEAVLRKNAAALKDFFGKFSDLRVVVEGHCDERGTSEYNLALGDRRATASRDFLVGLGAPAGKLTTISYGEERSVCSSEEESCWQQNRRAHLSLR